MNRLILMTAIAFTSIALFARHQKRQLPTMAATILVGKNPKRLWVANTK